MKCKLLHFIILLACFLMHNSITPQIFTTGEVCEHDTNTLGRSGTYPSMGNAFKQYDGLLFACVLYSEKIKVGL
jgi:hypothetical protein